MANCDGNI